MEKHRIAELEFLLRTQTPVPMVETRNHPVYQQQPLDDHFTVSELIEQSLLKYVGRTDHRLFVRPQTNFSVLITDEVRELTAGEVTVLQLGEWGNRDFAEWERSWDQ